MQHFSSFQFFSALENGLIVVSGFLPLLPTDLIIGWKWREAWNTNP
jgi:hypothetical protein